MSDTSDFAVLNDNEPPQLLRGGILEGSAIELDLSSLREQVHSRAATVLKGHSSKHGLLAVKVVFKPDVREPHNLQNEVCVLARLSHDNVCLFIFSITEIATRRQGLWPGRIYF